MAFLTGVGNISEVNWDHPGNLSCRRKRTIDSLYCDNKTMESVMELAKAVIQRSIYPSFFMEMIPSDVSYTFFPILPAFFCKFYMPKEDSEVILVDEEGQEMKVKFFAKRHGLSAGWRRFALDHKLSKGNILVFHRIATTPYYKLKVRIFCLDAADAAQILMDFHDSGEGTYSNNVARDRTLTKSEMKVMKIGQTEDQSESRCDDRSAEVAEDEELRTLEPPSTNYPTSSSGA